MRCGRCRLLLTAVLAVALAGCASLPNEKPAPDGHEVATTSAGAGNALARFSAARATVDAELDAGALADLETGSLLDIDRGAYVIRQQLGSAAASPEFAQPDLVLSGEFDDYPLWFVTVAAAPAERTRVVSLFVRASSTEPWRVALAPRLALDTALPVIAADGSGAESMLSGDVADGIAGDYADVLEHPGSQHADEFEADAFIAAMRAAVEAQPTDHVRFAQTWQARPVRYVFEIDGGGALAFVDLTRTDRYHIVGDHELSFDGSEASAFLSAPVHRSARLTYRHEVLLFVPATGKAFALGEYGGLVSAVGR